MSSLKLRILGDRTGHLAHRELDAALAKLPRHLEARWTPTDSPGAYRLEGVAGLWVVPGSPYKNDEAVLRALRAAREEKVPLLATCGGFQYALLELARNCAGVPEGQHAEVAPDAAQQVLVPLACSLIGEVRAVTAVRGTRLGEILGEQPFDGYHWCRYGLDPVYLPRLRDAGLVENAHGAASGLEGFELREHPFYLATLFQPQVGSSKDGPLHPLIAAWVEAARFRETHATPA